MRHLETASGLEEAGRLDEALRHLDAAIQRAPALAKAHFLRGYILQTQGQPTAALAAYEAALALDPDFAPTHYNRGNALLQLGQQEEAASAYRRAIAFRPEFVDAEVALGYVLEDLGQGEEAERHYRRALELRPDYAEVHYNLGRLFRSRGNDLPAAAHYGRAATLRPEWADAHFQHGLAMQALGQLEAAAAAYRRVTELEPANAAAHSNLGGMMQQLERFEEAASSYQRALALQPALAEVHANLGVALESLGQYEAAAASCRQAIGLKPGFAEAHLGLGNALRSLGRLDEAADSYRKAIELGPNLPEAHSNLGVVLRERGLLDQARACFLRALELNPDYADAHNNLGIMLARAGAYQEALASYRRALKLKPSYPEAHMNLGSLFKDMGEFEQALAHTRHALELKPDYHEARSNLLFIHNYLADQPASQLLEEARAFGAIASAKARPFTRWRVTPETTRCLRIGLVSGDLCSHPVGYFLVGVLEALTRQTEGRVELHAYATHDVHDKIRDRIRACCRGWRFIKDLSDEALAQRIHDDAIDILIDLAGHTAHSRLAAFARKPAPVQASWLGYFATTGVAQIDYFIADPWTLPEAEEAGFTEKIWRLPETRLCFTPPDSMVTPGPLPALQQGHVTFGCFNNLAKMNDAVVACWARILAAVPESRLLLKAAQLGDIQLQRDTAARYATRGIGRERLIFEDFTPRADYLAAYRQVDIAVDPFPYPGGTTTAEALWMGVPVLTLAGERFLARQGVGLLMSAGLPAWVASDADDYVARAVGHAADLPRLAALREGLRDQVLASPLFDAPRFAHHFEEALRGMWSAWCTQQR